MIKAAITPGIHPKKVRIRTINTDPQPLSKTAKGGKRIDKRTRQKPMCNYLHYYAKIDIFFHNTIIISKRIKSFNLCIIQSLHLTLSIFKNHCIFASYF